MDYARHSVLNGDTQLLCERRLRGSPHYIFAHGWISSRRMWREVLNLLPDGMSATAFDFRGCGESDRPLNGHDLDGYAADLRAVLSDSIGPVIVVGHSMGARVAQYVALDPPPNYAAMILVAPGVASATVAVRRHRELTELAFGSRRRIYAFQRGAMTRELRSEVMERIVDDALIAQREHWFGWYDDGRRLDFSAELAAVKMPVAVIAGECDPLLPLGRVRREVVDRYPGATLRIVPDAGHNLAVEAPTAIVDAIMEINTANLFPSRA